jgi:hypothetical protein
MHVLSTQVAVLFLSKLIDVRLVNITLSVEPANEQSAINSQLDHTILHIDDWNQQFPAHIVENKSIEGHRAYLYRHHNISM